MAEFRKFPPLKPLAAVFFAAVLGVFLGSVQAFGATVSGEIKIAGGKKLKNLIVYLEPADKKAIQAAQEQIVTQKDRIFKPDVTVIVAGGKIIFHNDEDKEIDHNVYSLSKAKKFDIGLVSKGDKLDVDFPRPGIVKYYCSVHKNMEGIVFVVPSPFYAIVEKPGPFTIDNVPAGKWKLNASISHRRYAVTPVDVSVSDAPVDKLTLQVARKKRRKKK